jgi:hypothetical protein
MILSLTVMVFLMSGEWTSNGYTLFLAYYGTPGVILTFKTTSPNHMELTDTKGDTIQLTKIKDGLHS